jgi:hypothetical protein
LFLDISSMISLERQRNTQSSFKIRLNHWFECIKMKPSLRRYGSPNLKPGWENYDDRNIPSLENLTRPILIVVHAPTKPVWLVLHISLTGLRWESLDWARELSFGWFRTCLWLSTRIDLHHPIKSNLSLSSYAISLSTVNSISTIIVVLLSVSGNWRHPTRPADSRTTQGAW